MKKLLLLGMIISSFAMGKGLTDKIFGKNNKINIAKEDAVVYSTDEGYEFKVKLDNNKTDDYISITQGGSRADNFLPIVNVYLNKPLPKESLHNKEATMLISDAADGIIADTENDILGNVNKIIINLIDYDNDGYKEIVMEFFDADEFKRVVLLSKYDKKEKKYIIRDSLVIETNTAGIDNFGYSEARGNALEIYYLYESDGTFKEVTYQEAVTLGAIED